MLVVLGSAGACFGQSTNAPVALDLPNSGSAFLALLRVLGSLALVFGLFFVGLWGFRNWQRFATRQGRPPKLAVSEIKSLGQRHTLYVVGYEQQRLLIAASPTGVTLLTALPDAEQELEPVATKAAPVFSRDFAGMLLQALARKS